MPHTEEFHTHRLSCMCRMCGRRLRKYSAKRANTRSVLCSAYARDVRLYYGIDVEKDSVLKHPNRMCQSCYRRLNKMQKVNTPSETMLKNAKSGIESCNHVWAEYDSTASVLECSVCSHFQEQSKGSARKKPRGGKRRSGQRQGSESDDGEDVTPMTPVDDQPTFVVPLGTSTPSKRPRMVDAQTSPFKTVLSQTPPKR